MLLNDVFEHAKCQQCSNNATCMAASELFVAEVSVSRPEAIMTDHCVDIALCAGDGVSEAGSMMMGEGTEARLVENTLESIRWVISF